MAVQAGSVLRARLVPVLAVTALLFAVVASIAPALALAPQPTTAPGPLLESSRKAPVRPGPAVRPPPASPADLGLPGVMQRPVDEAVLGALFGTIKKPTVPLLLLCLLGGFLVLQNRIDRRDPKLTSAPVDAEPELEFGPTFRGGTSG